MRPWSELLAQKHNDLAGDYGPHTAAVGGVFSVLRETQWLENAGVPISRLASPPPIVVRSWSEALEPLASGAPRRGLSPHGHLLTPLERAWKVIRNPVYEAWWRKARAEAERFDVTPFLPAALPLANRGFVEEYLHQFISCLLAEVIAPEEAGSTYFREQLQWFHDGHFPCGWEGDWPVGRMRVY